VFGLFKKKQSNEEMKLSFLMKAIKQADWVQSGENAKIFIDVDSSSCYEDKEGKVFAIWRLRGKKVNQYKYIFVCIYRELLWEDESAGIVKKLTPLGNDNYETESKIQTLDLDDAANKAAITSSCGFASFNGYSSMPPYILGL